MLARKISKFAYLLTLQIYLHKVFAIEETAIVSIKVASKAIWLSL